MQCAQRVDRVRRPLALQFNITDIELVVRGGRREQHRESERRIGHDLIQLMRRHACWHKDQSVELQQVTRIACNDQVADVWRIEGAAEKADSHKVFETAVPTSLAASLSGKSLSRRAFAASASSL